MLNHNNLDYRPVAEKYQILEKYKIKITAENHSYDE